MSTDYAKRSLAAAQTLADTLENWYTGRAMGHHELAHALLQTGLAVSFLALLLDTNPFPSEADDVHTLHGLAQSLNGLSSTLETMIIRKGIPQPALGKWGTPDPPPPTAQTPGPEPN